MNADTLNQLGQARAVSHVRFMKDALALRLAIVEAQMGGLGRGFLAYAAGVSRQHVHTVLREAR
jgi:hypothetical protein